MKLNLSDIAVKTLCSQNWQVEIGVIKTLFKIVTPFKLNGPGMDKSMMTEGIQEGLDGV